MSKFTKTQRVDFIRKKITTDRNWAIRGLLRIYENQTEEEKSCAYTISDNGIGFSAIDSKFLTSVCEFYLKTNFISDKQMSIVFTKIKKYAVQIHSLADIEKLERIMERTAS